MMNRRQAIRIFSAGALTTLLPGVCAAAKAKRVLFVHGRGQEGRNPEELKAAWIDTLRRGAAAAQRALPADVEFAFPFYGDLLAQFVRANDIPLTSEIAIRGAAPDNEFLAFQAEVAEELRQRAGVTDEQVDEEYGDNPRPRGALNWAWVQAILRALDKHGGGMGAEAIESFTRDVFLYCTRSGVRDEINRIVGQQLTEAPTVVVAHSLGTVVAYNVLRTDLRKLQVPVFVTVGSPLGVRAVRNNFRPLRSPHPPVDDWYNAFDKRDVVALYPLDSDNFPVQPAITNNNTVRNHTDNRHGIDGYLDDPSIAKIILDALE